MAVDTVHPQYRQFETQWRRMRDVLSGQEAMQRPGATYLRRPWGIMDSKYDAMWRRYVESTPFFEATQRTVVEGRECVRERCGQSASRAGKARVLSA